MDYVCEQANKGTMYYICNMATGKFLNDNNGLDGTPTVMWNIDMENLTISSQNGRYISCKSGFLGTNAIWTSDAVYDAESCVMKDIKFNDNGYYEITKSTATYLSISNDKLSNDRLSLNGNSRWILISKKQYEDIEKIISSPTFECADISEGTFYLYNCRSGQFLKAADSPMTNIKPTLWQIMNVDGDKYTISSGKKGVALKQATVLGSSTITTTSDNPDTITIKSVKDGCSISFTYPTLLGTATRYMAVEHKSEYTNNINLTLQEDYDLFACWTLVTEEQFNSYAHDRNLLKDRLSLAIQMANDIKELPAPTAVKGTNSDILGVLYPNGLYSTLRKAETYYKEIDQKTILGKYKHSENTILDGCIKLETATELVVLLTDYYSAAIEDIDMVSALPGGVSTASAAAAKVAINACTTKDAIKTALQVLKAECTLVMRATTLKEHDNLTGLLTNHSFDMGDMTGWYSIGNVINTSTMPTINEGDNKIIGGHNKYYYMSPNTLALGNQVYQPIIGLNGGGYRISSCMVPLGSAKEVGMTAYVVPNEVINLNPGDSITDAVIEKLTSNIVNILRDAKTYSVKKDMTDATAFDTIELDMQLDDNSFFIIALGSTSLSIGSFAVDNVCLTYECDVWPSALAKAKEDAVTMLKLEAIGDNSNQMKELLDSITGEGGDIDKCTTMKEVKDVRDTNLGLISNIKSFNTYKRNIIIKAQLLNPANENGRAEINAFVEWLNVLYYDESKSLEENKADVDQRFETLKQSLDEIATAINSGTVNDNPVSYSTTGIMSTSSKVNIIVLPNGLTKKVVK